MTAIKSVMC